MVRLITMNGGRKEGREGDEMERGGMTVERWKRDKAPCLHEWPTHFGHFITRGTIVKWVEVGGLNYPLVL